MARIFGYNGTSWLGQVVRGGKESDARALIRLLSPSGPLFTAMYNADADGSIRFHFPRQRLPTHTQMMLATPAGIKFLGTWPQYAGVLDDAQAVNKGHIHVSVFQYFCYWFAFYAIKGGDGGTGDFSGSLSGGGPGSAFGVSVRRAAESLHLTRGRDAASTRHPYIAMLRQLLEEMVPRPAGAAAPSPLASPGRTGAATRSVAAKRSATAASRGLLFYSILLEFWMKDADEPVPVASTGAGARRNEAGAGSPMAPLWSTTYEPPSEDLLEALGEVIRYATVASTSSGRTQSAQAGASWLPPTPVLAFPVPGAPRGGSGAGPGPGRLGAAGQPGAQALARQLYRFFHRAFTMWPDQRTMKPLLRAFLAYLAPWQAAAGAAGPLAPPGAAAAAPGAAALTSHFTAQMSGLATRVGLVDSQRGDGAGSGGYSPEWEAHVLANIPFYLELLPLYLERSISRVSVRGETAVQDVVRVMGVLEAAPSLVDMLRQVERDYNRCLASQPRRAEGPFAELLPWLVDQAHDWQVSATANCMGDTPALRSAPAYAMFTPALERCAALTAKDLLDLSSGVLRPDAFEKLKVCLERVLPLAELAAHPASAAAARPTAAALAQATPQLPRSSWRDVKYKGDPLRRPVTSYEIAPLVRALVGLSEAANRLLGLDRPVADEDGVVENRAQEALVHLRRKGWKVNLRPLADVRNLVWLPLLWWVGSTVLRVLWWFAWAILTGPDGGDESEGL